MITKNDNIVYSIKSKKFITIKKDGNGYMRMGLHANKIYNESLHKK